MNNCVIYARFSSHGQNEQSIEAQVRICKEYAENKGFDVVNLYTDFSENDCGRQNRRFPVHLSLYVR